MRIDLSKIIYYHSEEVEISARMYVPHRELIIIEYLQ